MNQKNFLWKGTLFLTGCSMLSRLLGFFYRIFLARILGAEAIGIFQLTLPVYLFFLTMACGGVQTAVSRFSAEETAAGRLQNALRILLVSISFSFLLSLFLGILIFCFSDLLACVFLAEPRCADLIRILAFSFPLSIVHSCITGWFLGKKQLTVPAFSQLLEQTARILFVILFYLYLKSCDWKLSLPVIALGQLFGEGISSVFCLSFLVSFCKKTKPEKPVSSAAFSVHSLNTTLKKILPVSVPVSLSRMLTCIMQAIETALIPQQLVLYGSSKKEALVLYGTLTGMALPLILFPTAVTNSLSSLLLPVVSEARTLNQNRRLTCTLDRSLGTALLLGLTFLNLFLLFGIDAGQLLFHNSLAGSFIITLAWLCPFLYLNTTLHGILHGMDHTPAVSLFTVSGFLIRILSVLFLIPHIGMDGYFTGLFLSQIFVSILGMLFLFSSSGLSISLRKRVQIPLLLCCISTLSVKAAVFLFPDLSAICWKTFLIRALLYAVPYGILLFQTDPSFRSLLPGRFQPDKQGGKLL